MPKIDAQVGTFLYIIVLFAILYFIIVRPQQQRQKKHQEMVRRIAINDSIITAGGIFGTVVKVKDDSLIIRVADNVRVEVLRSTISQVTKPQLGGRE